MLMWLEGYEKNELSKEIQRILRAEKRQSAVIETLERLYRALQRLRGTPGDVIIDRSIDDRKWDTLIEEISSAVRESSGHNLGTLGLPSGPIRRRLKGILYTTQRDP